MRVLNRMEVNFQNGRKLRRRHFRLFSTADVSSFHYDACSSIVIFHVLCKCKTLRWLYLSVSNTIQDTMVCNVTYISWFRNCCCALMFIQSNSFIDCLSHRPKYISSCISYSAYTLYGTLYGTYRKLPSTQKPKLVPMLSPMNQIPFI
jgi:hypothetical protein